MKNARDTGASGDVPATGKAGQRDENSVMFSLSALVAKEASSKKVEQPTNDESGLIDLKALAAIRSRPATTEMEPESGGLFGAPAPPPAAVVQAPALPAEIEEPKKRSKALPAVIAIAGLSVAALVGAIVVRSTGGGPVLGAESSLNAAARGARTAQTTLEAQAAAEAAKTAAVVTPGTPSSKTAPVTQGGGGGRAAPVESKRDVNPGPAPGPAPAPGPKPAPAPANDPCGGDLMCAMQRAAKKK